jgi:hypothetical protein
MTDKTETTNTTPIEDAIKEAMQCFAGRDPHFHYHTREGNWTAAAGKKRSLPSVSAARFPRRCSLWSQCQHRSRAISGKARRMGRAEITLERLTPMARAPRDGTRISAYLPSID